MSDNLKMTKEQFALHVFDKTVDLFGSLNNSVEIDFANEEHKRDEFDKTYRFLAGRLRDRLEEQGITLKELYIPEL
ncbi:MULTISPECIES: hypothetical protein [Providencia]|uniref:Uncharacterized protein n=1 Tax=Providencia huaxiensis TaxID=2027290 RepID=A0ABU2IWM5_9GAMM|nr:MULTISPECIES: hypothetical protein [Providencia]EJD6377073.1 hypothetical protein [Providencia rettgeri]ELR5117172.1 hypothetical protein [Providencia rettgeri]MDT0133468.1 hypothetical protein [Providencia huaxiensis]MDT1979874.1 hypothetical protein [Providencia huaxiensis]RFT10765.1 hypothetical protein DYB39_07205 [Providencia rettgeri]